MKKITYDNLLAAIRQTGETINRCDPTGMAHATRLLVSQSLYKSFDDLRARYEAFDRMAFIQQLARANEFIQLHPEISEATVASESRQNIEAITADLYSRCWTYYSDEQFLEMAGLFNRRFIANGIEIDIKGKRCIDLGCGSGRYVIAMADLGADEAFGLDLSEKAIEDANSRSQRLGYGDRCHFKQGSVLELPFSDGEFDFVSCNGVLHHTTDPFGGLRELARVTKKSGEAYIMVYGSGELWWDLTDMIRSVLEPVPRAFAFTGLELLGVPPGKIFNFMDHMYVPCREVISHQEFQDRLHQVGFKSWKILNRGEMIDSAERKVRFPEDADLVGEADLRYICSF